MLPLRNISYLLPMCCSFREKCKNSPKTGLGCSTPLMVKNCNVRKCCVLFTSLLITWIFINIKSNLSIKSEYLPSVACQLMPSPSIRHLTVSVCPSSDASISAVQSYCKSNKYHLNEKYSIMVKTSNIRKCCVLIHICLLLYVNWCLPINQTLDCFCVSILRCKHQRSTFTL